MSRYNTVCQDTNIPYQDQFEIEYLMEGIGLVSVRNNY